MLAQKMRCSGTWTHFRLPASCPWTHHQHKEMEVMSQRNHTNYSDPTITVKGLKLQTEDKFTYRGSTLSRNVFIDDEGDARIAKARTTFGWLRKNVWERQGLNLQTKLKVYKAVVVTTLLYTCKTWTVYCRHARKLNRFHINCLHRLLHNTWQDMTPDTEVLKHAKCSCSAEESSTSEGWPCCQNER